MSDGSERPKRPRSHEVGDVAVDSFRFHRPPNWVVNPSQSDYGWDLIVTPAENYEVTEEDFFVQLKGSDTPHYIESGSKIAFPLETGRINWLLARPMPSMLAISDTSREDSPVYWVWIRNAVDEILKSDPKALEQQTLTLHIPVSNLLGLETSKTIEEDVRRFHSNRTVRENMGQTILSALGPGAQAEDLLSYKENPASFLFKHGEPLFNAGILSLPDDHGAETVSALSVQDQARFRTLKEIQTALKELRERDAKEALEKIEQDVEQGASNYIRAFFHNLRGQLRQYMGQLPEAVEDYVRAKEYRPGDVAHEAGLLHAEFALAWCSQDFSSAFPKDWIIRADNVLAEKPQECRIIRLKAAYVCETNGPTQAEEFLRASVSWQLEPRQSLCYLAYLHSHGGNLESAQRLLDEAEALGLELDAMDWSIYGFILLRKAFRGVEPQKDTPIYGPGPANMDFGSLRRARDCYEKSYEYFRRRGFPKVSGETVINYTIVLRLLGQLEHAAQACRSYLNDNVDDPHAHGALAGCLMALDQAVDAVTHARAAFDLEPQSSLAFSNLALCLYQAEEFDDLLRLLYNRQESGFLDKHEEELCRFLGVTAYTELGKYKEAENLIQETKNLPEFARSVPIMEAVLVEKMSTDRERVIKIFRQACQDYPADVSILTHFVSALFPIISDTAPDLICCLEELRTLRQLASHEYRMLAQAYVCMERPENADSILDEGLSVFVDDSRLIAERVNVQVELGNDEKAYELLSQVRGCGISEYSTVSNLAVLAARTGRLDKAIEFLERSLSKAKDDREKGIIHHHLYQLRLKKGDDPETILRHAVNFGKTISTDEEEVTYLVMFMMSPKITEPSEEIALWTKDFQKRYAQFTEKHPDFPSFKSFKIPEDVPEEERGFWIASEMASIMLPHELATAKLWQSAREKQWPLVFRASYCPGESVFDYWSRCSGSDTFDHSIHILGSGNDLDQETEAASRRDSVCMDVTALITVAALDLLDLIAELFRLIFISQDTRHTILMDSSVPSDQHPLAVKINDWIEANRTRIRVRKGNTAYEKCPETEPYGKSPGGIWMQQRNSALNFAFPYGGGESLLLSKKLGVPLYTDESALTLRARKDYGVMAFSTVGLARALVNEGLWTNDEETDIFVSLIKMNYRWVPFGVTHLNCRLRKIISTSRRLGNPITSAVLFQDEPMLNLMRWFGEPKVKPEGRTDFAIIWWCSIISSDLFEKDVLASCMTYPTHCYISVSKSSVLNTQILKNEREMKAARLLSRFLWVAYKNCERHFQDVWLAIKDCVNELFPQEESVRRLILLELLPKWLHRWARRDESVDENRRTSYLVHISSSLPYEDKEPFEMVLTRLFVRKGP